MFASILLAAGLVGLTATSHQPAVQPALPVRVVELDRSPLIRSNPKVKWFAVYAKVNTNGTNLFCLGNRVCAIVALAGKFSNMQCNAYPMSPDAAPTETPDYQLGVSLHYPLNAGQPLTLTIYNPDPLQVDSTHGPLMLGALLACQP
jgi:hypothetical protein